MKKLQKVLFIFSFLFTAFNLNAQPTLEWVRLYPGNSSFQARSYDLAQDDSGNIYVTGFSDSGNTGSNCTIKYSNTGAQLWVSYFTGPLGVTAIGSIALDDSSNVYVTGFSNNGSTFFDYCTIKYNSSGIQQWFRYFNGIPSGEDAAEKIAVDKAGNIYVSGYSEISGGGFAYTTIKYSRNGKQLWVRVHSFTSGNTHVTGMKTDDSCNIYITGDCVSAAVTVKYDSSGTQLWSKEYFGFGPLTGAKDIAIDANNIYITGFTKGVPPRYRDIFTIKYSTAGIQIWEKIFFYVDTANASNSANTVTLDNLSNIIVSGITSDIQLGNSKICLIKYSNSGSILWAIRDTSGGSTSYIDIDKSNNIYLAGRCTRPPPFYSSMTTIKYDAAGNTQWRVIDNTVNFNSPAGIIVDSSFNIYLSGGSQTKMCTYKYSQQVGIININTETPKQYKLYQNYPNPFNPTTNIKFQISKKSDVKLLIYDILGKELMLINEELIAGTYEVSWAVNNYSSGIYFYKLTSGDYTESRKMVCIK